MINSKLLKTKIANYWGSRKYRLSFFGNGPGADWFTVIIFFVLGMILITVLAFNYENRFNARITTDLNLEKQELNLNFAEIEEYLNSNFISPQRRLNSIPLSEEMLFEVPEEENEVAEEKNEEPKEIE